jgi:hypothetical protein
MRSRAQILRSANEWIVGDHVGLSSKTIWAVMMGVPCRHPSPPGDDDDRWRCARLLRAVPEWRERLDEVVAAYPHSDWILSIDRLKDDAWCASLLVARIGQEHIPE